MMSRFTFILPMFICSFGLAACQSHDSSADAPAPSSQTDTPSTPPPQSAADQPSSPAAPTPPPSPTASEVAAGPEPVAGTDYDEIDGGQPYAPMKGKIEVAEVFGYVCPACFALQSSLSPWQAGLPSDVHFVLVPALFGGTWDTYARAFYASETLGLVAKSHEALFRAIHVDHLLKGEQGNDSEQDIARFYTHYQVDVSQFINTMHSFGVDARVNHAKEFAQRSKITGTPSLIIDGKYLVKGHSFEDMLRIADHLIARERSAMQHASAP